MRLVVLCNVRGTGQSGIQSVSVYFEISSLHFCHYGLFANAFVSNIISQRLQFAASQPVVFYSSMCYLWEIILSRTHSHTHTLKAIPFEGKGVCIQATTFACNPRSNSVFYVLPHKMSPVSNDFDTMYQLSDVYLICGMVVGHSRASIKCTLI